MNAGEITAAEAVKKFERQGIKIQVPTPREKKPGDLHAPGFNIAWEPLAAEHILAVRRYHDGKIVIVTIDGRRLEAR